MNAYIDVFNGDADGLCSLVQLRRANPQDSQLITGIKRDIKLLRQVQTQGNAHVTVLDISFDKNASEVKRVLESGCSVSYIDHHQANDLFKHPRLQTDIDLAADTCTSLIVDQQLKGQFRAWAITAAFGDNLTTKAYDLGADSGFSSNELDTLNQLGVCLNYNGYGASLDDLFFHPALLYKKLQPFDTPFEFMQQDHETFTTLLNGYQQDISQAQQNIPVRSTSTAEVVILPNQKWARRVSGVYANELANKAPEKAHAILTEQENNEYLVSIRAPLNFKFGADIVASQFLTGGGRKAAAGINALPEKEIDTFFNVFEQQFSSIGREQ
jgi:single-stranded DNA-specific DHH superfamily exonuclease